MRICLRFNKEIFRIRITEGYILHLFLDMILKKMSYAFFIPFPISDTNVMCKKSLSFIYVLRKNVILFFILTESEGLNPIKI